MGKIKSIEVASDLTEIFKTNLAVSTTPSIFDRVVNLAFSKVLFVQVVFIDESQLNP